ncbi:hypothetical protein M2103_002217 [Ereboglobus sp. PH5-5]|uniref:hypothetical protein n=1 Tax=Ereboglobus sp. PH5-5 TaxID=2940529 RepID=UPI0024053DFA|nr:hypothetical protein [Ereboglobus sp. PH5-5]MDF9833982.1 hypothetical protein [Ereboglobus sp. PH5-5]
MIRLLPVLILTLFFTGCGPKKEALYVPIYSTVEIPVFDNDAVNEFMAMYAKQHDGSLAAMDLMIQGNIDAGMQKYKEVLDETSANSFFERMKETTMALGDKSSELLKYQEYGRKIREENQQRLNELAKKYPDAASMFMH